MHRLPVAALAAALLLAGCNPGAPREGDAVTVTTDTPAPAATPGASAPGAPTSASASGGPIGFVNRVWRVSASDAVAPGTHYVFLAESTLVIDGPGGRPAVGTWRRDGEGLVMVEDGIASPTDIVELTGDRFRIRSHNPGRPVEITLVPAAVTR